MVTPASGAPVLTADQVRQGPQRRRATRDSGGDPRRVGARKRRVSAVRRDADPAQSQSPSDGSSSPVGESRLWPYTTAKVVS